MKKPSVLILNSGGIRSLVATASVLSGIDRPNVALLHLRDGRPNVNTRSQHVNHQAEHFEISHVTEANITPQPEKHHDDITNEPPTALLADAVTYATEAKASRLVWPAQSNGDFSTASQITEQIVLAQNLAHEKLTYKVIIETPLTDLTDKQLIELGEQLGVPWNLAWSCLTDSPQPCGDCDGCARRKSGFNAAGTIDPAIPSSSSH